jgi:hypothetical protein
MFILKHMILTIFQIHNYILTGSYRFLVLLDVNHNMQTLFSY